MKIAVTYENGEIFQHFGHTEHFKLYNTDGTEITESRVVDSPAEGHGALTGFLSENGVEILICGGIGAGAQNSLAEAGITLYGGASGKADDAVKQFLADTLIYDPNVKCTHHENGEHNCGEHNCSHQNA